MRNEEALSGLGIDGQGAASLRDAVVSLQPWSSQDAGAYGGVVGLACRYRYTKTDGSPGIFTLYIEYLHLITPAFLPKDGQGHVISAESWAATGKGIGFGPRMQNGASLTAEDLTGREPLLVGYLGATEFPHVHIQAAYGPGEQGYLRTPRLDPTVMLRSTATTTQAWALGLPSLAFNDQSFHYDVPGTFEPLVQPNSMACWATVATMLVCWRDQASYSIAAVCDTAGPKYRSYFDKNTGLARADKPAFLQRLGQQEEPPASYTIGAYKDMLRSYGPLWVTADVGSPGTVSIHARVMTGIYGDGSADNTFVWLVDPADGQRHSETFAHFSAAFEQLARDVGATEPLWVQIIHNPPPPSAAANSFAAPSSTVTAVPGQGGVTPSAGHRPGTSLGSGPGQGPGSCVPAALSLGIAYAPPLSSALYDTGEHVLAGEQAYALPLRVGPDPGVPFTYGELVAMPDLYGSVAEMMRASSDELTALKALIDQSAAFYRGHKADQKLNVGDDQWENATGHRYLRLAEDNYEHFSSPWVVDPSAGSAVHGDNHSAWEAHHRWALEEAHRLAMAPENAASTFVPEWPLIINAFGDHFLTDAFSAGHLINKDVVLAAVQSRFYSGDSLASAAGDFLDRVAQEAFVGDVAAKFSELETYDPIEIWGFPLWRPDIDSVSRFRRMLTEFATQEPGKFGNVMVKLLHDHLNENGVTVSNQAGDPPWLLTGDYFLNDISLSVMRRAVARSAQNVIDVADSRQPGPPDVAVAADQVWRFVPQLPPESRATVSGLTQDFTDPTSRTLSSAVAAMIRTKVDAIIQGLLAEHKLRRA
jgi:Papain-like cysteine protease AvrRpt2